MEALLGAFLVAGGYSAALAFLQAGLGLGGRSGCTLAVLRCGRLRKLRCTCPERRSTAPPVPPHLPALPLQLALSPPGLQHLGLVQDWQPPTPDTCGQPGAPAGDGAGGEEGEIVEPECDVAAIEAALGWVGG